MPLEVKDLRMYYEIEGGGWVKAVDNVSFTLGDNDSFGIVGESGCGKSSLATTLLRLLPINARILSGEILLDGVDILKLPEDRLRRDENDTRKPMLNMLSVLWKARKKYRQATLLDIATRKTSEPLPSG